MFLCFFMPNWCSNGGTCSLLAQINTSIRNNNLIKHKEIIFSGDEIFTVNWFPVILGIAKILNYMILKSLNLIANKLILDWKKKHSRSIVFWFTKNRSKFPNPDTLKYILSLPHHSFLLKKELFTDLMKLHVYILTSVFKNFS